MGIKLLDCTLRDGGHQNKGKFGEASIRRIINGLVLSKTELIEVGFLRESNVGVGYSAENAIHNWEKRFPELLENDKCEYTIMIQQDQYPISKLPEYKGAGIGMIRVSFHDYDREEGFKYAAEVKKKNYKCFINPINLCGYSDSEIIGIVEDANKIGVDGFTIVDTFGAMTKDDLLRIFMLVDHNLMPSMTIGIHLHDNLKMAFALAQIVAEMVPEEREVIVDGSLLGMGREPGNLCIELMMEYLNRKNGKSYDVDAALDVIDSDIAPLMKVYPWGYETAYSLSAQYKLHRTYAEYLMKKQKLKTTQIRQILGQIEKTKKSKYDEKYIEQIYFDYISSDVDDHECRKGIARDIGKRKVLVLAPGNSLRYFLPRLSNEFPQEQWFIICANFCTGTGRENFVFCSNAKRFEQIALDNTGSEVIISSHIRSMDPDNTLVVNTNELAWFGNTFWDNCMLMILNMLKKVGICDVYVAGWDGFGEGRNFWKQDMEQRYDYEDENERVKVILKDYFSDMNIIFMTESLYK